MSPTEVELLIAAHGGVRAAARETGIPKTTLLRWRNKSVASEDAGEDLPTQSIIAGAKLLRERYGPEISMPEFPPAELPIDEIIDQKCRKFDLKDRSYRAHTWFPVTVNSEKPIGIAFVGDPHLDDDGAHWPRLRRDILALKDAPGAYAVNIGDTTNNWVGSLQQLYAKQSSTLKEARRFARWFMLESGVKWMLWLAGNHDAWNDGSDVLAEMARRYGTHQLAVHDWEARFKLVFPKANNREYKIFASHDFKGNSEWNPLHALIKASQKGVESDLYVAGHKHNWGTYCYENANRGLVQHLIRVRGYKYHDDYARRLGITEQRLGCTIFVVFNPWADDPSSRITVWPDLIAGLQYLRMLRANLL
jgi:hypothetical protein